MYDYQNSSWAKGVSCDQMSKTKDRKLVFIEPQTQMEQDHWLDQLIKDIMALNKKEYADLLATEIMYLLKLIIPILEQEPIIIEVEAPVTISGDIHGQLHDLLRFYNQIGPPPHKPYLFQGDYVDRNPNDVEVITLLFA